MISNPTEAFLHCCRHRPPMTSWLRSTEAPWQHTHSTCAVIVTGIVSRRWRRPASLYRHESQLPNCDRPPLWAHTMGRTMGRHIPACSKTWLALGPGQWQLFQTACVQKTARRRGTTIVACCVISIWCCCLSYGDMTCLNSLIYMDHMPEHWHCGQWIEYHWNPCSLELIKDIWIYSLFYCNFFFFF